ncbi:hypothetical protein GH714_023661 [Hevea brasiliensis]|uniref:Signal recognition particle receptor subunit beta n=1 Tax=Hevea brasiliensis TaxID=3981 RepID=A0A6A6KE51_HEVBR|nr:hypothetical protein GH714_023661 [Hevea brasiliensis]
MEFADCKLKMEGMEQWRNEAKQWLQQGIEYAHQIPPTQLYATAAVLLLTTLFFLIKRQNKACHLVDVPGHSRLRPKLDEFLPQAAGIVFVVDALEFLPNLRGVSEYLYDILTKASVVKRKVPVLICCNKADKVTAHSKEFIRKQLEKEIDKLRVSRSGISEADVANEFTLGIPGEAFSFSHCSNKVTIAESSGLTGEISQVEQFIREHVDPMIG